MLKRVAFVLVLLAVIFGVIFGFKYAQMQKMAAQQSQPPPPATVAAAVLEEESWRATLRSVGSLVAVNGISVASEVAGIVRSIAFESGQPVQEGAVLVQLDSEVDRAALEALRIDRQLAEIQFKRAQELVAKRALSRSEFDEAETRFAAAEARVAEQRTRIELKTIRAPFSGLLGLRVADLGQYLEPGDAIVSLEALDPIYADYSLSERYLQRIAPGQEVALRLDALPGESVSGRVIAIETGVDEGTRTVKVRAKVDNANRALRPGMFAEVQTLEKEFRTVLTAPRTAISFNTYGDFVFVIEESESGALVVARRQVSTGEVRSGQVEVVQGLQAGERVVRAGLVKLRDGQPVQIDNSVALKDSELKGQ
jgi:membrane fusion protein (multidrug efflux system)